jgi:hypothetical protein
VTASQARGLETSQGAGQARAGACTVYELRQYTLHPGQRDVLVDVFDRELVETQEAVGLRVVGQFRDLDDPERFVWFRGFADMQVRLEGLTAFYGGPAWAAHKDVANATMLDSDDVLLLRPVPGRDFPLPAARPHDVGAGEAPESRYVTSILSLIEPLDIETLQRVSDRLCESVEQAGGAPVAVLETEPARNDYEALPVREGEHVLVHVSRYANGVQRPRGEDDPAVQEARRHLGPNLVSALELRLAPTARSLLA